MLLFSAMVAHKSELVRVKKPALRKEEKGQGMHPAVVVLIVLLVLGVVAVGLTVGYKYWRKKKRQQEQARFLKLFEDGDEMEDEKGNSDQHTNICFIHRLFISFVKEAKNIGLLL